MKKLFFTTVLLITALFFNSCSSDDDNGIVITESNTIVDFVQNNEDYSSLEAALQAARLVDVLNGSTNYTVFAPNNASFAAFLTANGFASLEEVPVELLTQVLLNHVVSGTVLSSALETGYVNTNATFGDTDNNLSMYIDTSNDGVLINGETSVSVADNVVDNGVIHAVDKVIGLPSVVTFATADSTFETLVAALTR
jgi:transforming growth factor-beta-induced protein